MEAQSITVALIDTTAGYEASPDRVRLSDLAVFSADVAAFLRGDDKDVDTKTLDVAIRKGSLAIETAPILVAAGLFVICALCWAASCWTRWMRSGVR